MAVSDVVFSLSVSDRFWASIRRLARSICFLLEATSRFLRFEFGIVVDCSEKIVNTQRCSLFAFEELAQQIAILNFVSNQVTNQLPVLWCALIRKCHDARQLEYTPITQAPVHVQIKKT